MNSIEHLKSAESLVRDILKNNPATRNSDFDLLFAVWKESGVELTTYQTEMIRKSFSPETIRRTRQKIQENGEYLPSERVLNGRSKLQQQHREFHKNPMMVRSKDNDELLIQEPIGYKTKEINGKKMRFAVYN